MLADEDVRRMIAEQVTDSRDTQILPGYGLAELALDSLHAYRNHFAAFRPGHPWTDLDDVAFLRKIGAWRHDAARKEDGLTLAGLLMFGNSSDPVHHALREALVNALVHADYSDRAAVKIVKSPRGFLFRNPGLMRVPPEQALLGGESDCRNGILHKLLLLIGLGERAGSGLPKIRRGWTGEIKLTDSMDPYNQTRLELRWPQPTKANSQKSSQETGDRILTLLRQDHVLTASKVALALGISMRAVQKQMASLQKNGRLRRVGPDKGGHWEVTG